MSEIEPVVAPVAAVFAVTQSQPAEQLVQQPTIEVKQPTLNKGIKSE
jgi:hypothetical protein